MPARRDTQLTTAPFFVTTFAITLATQLPAVLAERGFIPGPTARFMPFVGLGAMSPLLAAVLVSRFEGGGPGVRALFVQLGRFRAGAIWYVIALALPGATLAAGMAVYALFGGDGRLIYAPATGQAVAGMLVIPFAEEIGWRGFAFPRLQARYGPLVASLLFGLVWAVWHVPVFLLMGLAPSTLAISVPYFVAGSVIFTWLYNRPGGGLPLVILAHMGAHLSNSNQTLPGDVTPLVVHTLAFSLVALVLVLTDVDAWRRVPDASS